MLELLGHFSPSKFGQCPRENMLLIMMSSFRTGEYKERRCRSLIGLHHPQAAAPAPAPN